MAQDSSDTQKRQPSQVVGQRTPNTVTRARPERAKRPSYLPPLWVVIIGMGAGIYGTSQVYDALTGAAPWSDGLIGAAVMLLAVLVLGTPLALARIVRKEARAAARQSAEEGTQS
jgi:hypothetical protein